MEQSTLFHTRLPKYGTIQNVEWCGRLVVASFDNKRCVEMAEKLDIQEALLNEYRQAVCAMLESEDTREIKNSSPKHAAIIIEEMIRHTKTSFFAIAQRMNPVVWSQRVINALAQAKKDGKEVSLLLLDSDNISHLDGVDPIVKSCVRKLPRAGMFQYNLAVMDDCAVRFEYDVANDHALFYANNRELAGLARRRFDSLYSVGVRI